MKRENTQGLLVCKNLVKEYQNGDRHSQVIKPTNITIQKGTRNLIRGKSGSGKTTLLSMLAGIEPPTQIILYAVKEKNEICNGNRRDDFPVSNACDICQEKQICFSFWKGGIFHPECTVHHRLSEIHCGVFVFGLPFCSPHFCLVGVIFIKKGAKKLL